MPGSAADSVPNGTGWVGAPGGLLSSLQEKEEDPFSFLFFSLFFFSFLVLVYPLALSYTADSSVSASY